MTFGQKLRKKTKPPISSAIIMTDNAVEIAYQYLRDRRYRPNEEELAQFDRLIETLWQSHATAQYIARSLRSRTNLDQLETPLRANDV